jgi:hypothetical protein
VSAAPSWSKLVVELRRHYVEFDEGLTDGEIEHLESTYALKFPPDLRAFLQTALPISEDFAPWRRNHERRLREMLDWPVEGILFDVRESDFWRSDWGPRPTHHDDAEALAREKLAEMPRLIPIYSHRYIPSEPQLPGNPVFSVYQTDIIYYGHDLADYLRVEFNLGGRELWPEEVRRIRFWSNFI